MTGSALSPRLAVAGRGCRRRFVLLPNSRVSAHQGSRAHAAGRPTRFAVTCRSPAGRSSARARQAGSSRIPTFGSRIPKAGAASSGAPPQLPTPTAPPPPVHNAPTARHLGRRVRVGDKDAVLRFLGSAHFAKGTWCGVELSSPSGKHDGTVCGVRYFACQPLYGLMVPLSKVSVPFDPPDDVSGPYSMLFLADNDTESSNQDSDDGNCDLNATIVKQDGPIPNRTLVINETITKPNFDVTKEAQEGQNITYKKPLNLTLIRSETITKPSNATFDISSPDSPVDNLTYNKERRYTFDLKPFEENIQQESSVSKKRVNETFNTVENNNASSLDITKKNLTFLPINKSCEDLLNESSIEVKRRRTSNPKSHKIEPLILKQLDKTDSFDSPQQFTNGKLSSSTPMRAEFSDDLFRKLRLSNINSEANIFNVDDESNKRDSLDFEESLGILTPDQMIDFVPSRSPSVEYAVKFFNKTDVIPSSQLTSPREIIKIEETVLNIDTTLKSNKTTKDDELPSPNVNSITDYSLGIIDDRMLSECLFKTDTTMNMELPLDSKKDFSMIRCDQTPSPEELPLDTTPVVETSEPKTEPSKSTKTTSSFVTSITSITSLDTGYQGDGEMSRPASRGADNSPLTKRPIPRQQLRRPDPMTDSDFYTESDADNHEENHVRGDRKAQVIDGTLYGVDPQAAADIYVNNRENMDSSGVFTDIENNLRNEEEEIVSPNRTIDVSPSDSSKTISENSQSNLQEVLDRTMKKTEKENQNTPIKENSKKRNAPSPGISSPSSISSPRHNNKDESLAKKYKMPKRDVASKVKAMLEPAQNNVEKKTTLKKPVGRWDAVMNKISKNDQNKTNLKEVKSKVFNNVNLGNTGQRTASEGVRKTNVRQTNSPNNKVRRVRTRTLNKSGGNVESSINSSLSDLSAAAILPKKTPGSAKKRESIQVTQVLTPNKLPNNKNQQNLTETKKNATNQNASSSTNEPKFKRTIFSPKEKKQTTNNKECGKGAVKGGRTSPITTTGRTAVSAPQKAVQPPKVPRVPAPRTAEALAVLIQHLVFNVEAYQVPTLKRETQKLRLEADEIKQAYQQLEKRLVDERAVQVRQIENERERFREEVEDLIGKHREEITQITAQHVQIERQLRAEKENAHQYLCSQHEEQLSTLKKEFEKLQRTHEEALDILREENDSIREQIDEKRMEAETANHESVKLKKDYESREVKLKEQIDVLSAKNQRLKEQIGKSEGDFEDRVKALIDENKRLRDENDRLLSYGDDKEIGMQEVQSLRAVLELKQKEVGELRKTLAEATQKLELLVGAQEKAAALQARCEDLQHQLQRKAEYEKSLLQENLRLQESCKEENNQKRRLSQHNEELQWKLKQNKEIIVKVMEQAEESALNRSILSSSFNERHNNSSKYNLERTLSFRERSLSNKSTVSLEGSGSSRSRKSKTSLDFDIDDLSPPTSPKVKGVVEKSDSVSYVLEMDESPDVVASRIVRRSFRNTTPPKNTPTKSPSNKRPRIRNPLSLSASSSAIMVSNKDDMNRPRSASARNGDSSDSVFIWNSTPKHYEEEDYEDSCKSSGSMKIEDDHLDLDDDNEDDIQLPALPSEMDKGNTVLALPSPKHLAGEAMISESEDESTSSSQL